jgi:hypothetical protein
MLVLEWGVCSSYTQPLKVIKCDLTTSPQTFLIIQDDRAEDMDDFV